MRITEGDADVVALLIRTNPKDVQPRRHFTSLRPRSDVPFPFPVRAPAAASLLA